MSKSTFFDRQMIPLMMRAILWFRRNIIIHMGKCDDTIKLNAATFPTTTMNNTSLVYIYYWQLEKNKKHHNILIFSFLLVGDHLNTEWKLQRQTHCDSWNLTDKTLDPILLQTAKNIKSKSHPYFLLLQQCMGKIVFKAWLYIITTITRFK